MNDYQETPDGLIRTIITKFLYDGEKIYITKRTEKVVTNVYPPRVEPVQTTEEVYEAVDGRIKCSNRSRSLGTWTQSMVADPNVHPFAKPQQP